MGCLIGGCASCGVFLLWFGICLWWDVDLVGLGVLIAFGCWCGCLLVSWCVW